MSFKELPKYEKLKILCLHGYRQSGSTFKNKAGAFRKITKPYADFTFITAELEVCDNANSPEAKQETTRGWWFSKAENTFNAHDVSEICPGFETSIETVKKAVKENGPFDGILGFSQGAAFACLLCCLQQKGSLELGFKFAIMIAGFKSRCAPHREHYDAEIKCPSLHVFGETDKIIPKEMSEELLKQFHSPKIILHSGGHFTPAKVSYTKDYNEFLEKMLYHCNKFISG